MENIVLDNGKERGAALEVALEKALAGWMTPGSGNKNIKGDVRSKLFCAEAKYRSSYNEEDGYFITIDLQWLESIWRTAKKSRRIPLLAIEFGSGKRMAFLPANCYRDMEGVDEDWETEEKPGRAPKFTSTTCKKITAVRVIFPNIEVEEKEWAIISWEELIYLRKMNQK